MIYRFLVCYTFDVLFISKNMANQCTRRELVLYVFVVGQQRSACVAAPLKLVNMNRITQFP